MKYLQVAYDWTLRAPYRTWIAHALLSLMLAYAFGAWTAMVFYLLREIEQMVVHTFTGEPHDWADHFLDLSAPFLATGLASLIMGW